MGEKEEAGMKKGGYSVSKRSGVKGGSMYPQSVRIITLTYMV
jgi:hypothetical protein